MHSPPSSAEQEIENLYDVLDVRNDMIVDLERRLKDVLAAEDSTDEDRTHNFLSEIKELKSIISMLRQEANEKAVYRDNAEDDMNQMKDTVDSQRKLNQVVRTKIIEKDAEIRRLKDTNQSDTGEQYWLETENLRLREMVQELEGNEDAMIREIETLSNERYSLEINHKSKLCDVESLEVSLQEKGSQCVQYESEIKLLLGKCKALEEKQSRHCQSHLEMEKDYDVRMKKLKDELEQERQNNQVLDTSTALSYGKATQDDQAAQIDQLCGELEIADARIKTLEIQNISIKRDVDSAYLALEVAKNETKELNEQEARKEMKIEMKFHSKLQAIDGIRSQMKTKCGDLEQHLDQMRAEMRSSEERNARYEEGCGLTEAVVYQKKLESDIRRSEGDRKRMVVSLGEKEEKILLLIKKIQVISKGVGIGVLSHLDESTIEEMIQEEESSLRGQNKELLTQVETLEKERNSLMKRLRENAAQISEKGIRFLGLSAENMQHLLDFANSLKVGRMQLPLNDVSANLKSEVAALNFAKQSDFCTIDRLEKEIERLKLGQECDDSKLQIELGFLKQALTNIQTQNEDLQKSQVFKCLNCDIAEGQRQESNQTLVKNIEAVVREAIGSHIDPCNVGGPGNVVEVREDSTTTGTRGEQDQLAIMKHDFEAKIVGKDEELVRLRNSTESLSFALEESESSSQLKGIEFSRIPKKIVKSVHVQFDSDRAIIRELQVQIGITRDKMISSQQELFACRNKVKRLKGALKLHDSVHGDKKRIVVALAVVKELKACLEDKNRIIAKHREREIQDHTLLKLSRTSSVPSQLDHDTYFVCSPEVNNEDASMVSDLIKKLTFATDMIKEKDSALCDLKSELIRVSDSMHKSNKQCTDIKATLVRVRGDMDLLSQKMCVKQHEKLDMVSSLTQYKYQIKHNEETIESMSKSFKHLKKTLVIKNDDINKLSGAEAEVKRLQSSLSTTRRAEEKGRKCAKVSEQLCNDALQEAENLRTEASKLRKQITESRDDKFQLTNKYRRATTKIRDLKDALVPDMYEEKRNDCVVEDLNAQVSKLKQENVKLRGLVASYKLLKSEAKLIDVPMIERKQEHNHIIEKTDVTIGTKRHLQKHKNIIKGLKAENDELKNQLRLATAPEQVNALETEEVRIIYIIYFTFEEC